MPEPDSADPFAASVAQTHDLIPLLPQGAALFESIPAPAIVIEALGSAIGDGAVLLRRPGSVGVILVRDGDLFEEYAFEGGFRLDGQEALGQIATWQDATVTAYRFDRVVVSVAPALLRGSICYQDLRLEWTDWKGLLRDLRSRDGLLAVELETPAGRGVILIGHGRQVATYTENHPELGHEGLLDPLVASGRGTIRVRREQGGETPSWAAGPAPGAWEAEAPEAEAPEAGALEAATVEGPTPSTEVPGTETPEAEPPGELAASVAARPEPAEAASGTAGRMEAALSPPVRRESWREIWWRRRGRQVTLVAGCLLILTGLGLTAPPLIEQATVQQAVAARGANDVSAVNNWLAGSASPGPSAQGSTAATTGGTCGGASSEADAYSLVEFSGLSRYGYVGVAVNGNWTQLDNRSMVHWYGSPAPGGNGNAIIAFHREPDYQNIDQLVAGETVTIEDRSCRTYVYTVTQRWELAPSAVTQLVPTGGQELTLITCTPWWQDYNRLVWRAALTSVDGVPVSS